MKVKLQPRIEFLEKKILVGCKMIVSFHNIQTSDLWRNFMPRRKEIPAQIGNELYSVEVYDLDFFEKYSPQRTFEKWAAIEVSDTLKIPSGMHEIIIPTGLYAIFNYKGLSSKAAETFKYIYTNWIPNSDYSLDNRPHFAVMGDKYLKDNPDSEEEIWVPIKPRFSARP